MKYIKKIINELGIEIISTTNDGKYITTKYKNNILSINIFKLFGLSKENIINSVKETYKYYNINLIPNENTILQNKYLTIDQKKLNIRQLLTIKFKLIK